MYNFCILTNPESFRYKLSQSYHKNDSILSKINFNQIVKADFAHKFAKVIMENTDYPTKSVENDYIFFKKELYIFTPDELQTVIENEIKKMDLKDFKAIKNENNAN